MLLLLMQQWLVILDVTSAFSRATMPRRKIPQCAASLRTPLPGTTVVLWERRSRREDYWNDDDEGYDDGNPNDQTTFKEANYYDLPPPIYDDNGDLLSPLDRLAPPPGSQQPQQRKVPPPVVRNRKRADDRYDDYADDEDDDTDDYRDEPGNFWVNPVAGLDDSLPNDLQRRQQRRRRQSGRSDRTTFRAGAPPPPAPVLDLYNRLFWYGFDGSDDESVADKTMFGGTKGKFNGLSFLYDSVGVVPPEKRPPNRRRTTTTPTTRRNNAPARRVGDSNEDDQNYYYDDDDYYEDDDDEDDENIIYRDDAEGPYYEEPRARPPLSRSKPRPSLAVPVTPPYDPPRPMRYDEPPFGERTHVDKSGSGRSSGSRRREQQPRDRGDWVSNQVSSWFGQYDDDDEEQDSVAEERRGGGGRRRRQSQQSGRDERENSNNNNWSPFAALDTFLGLDRERLDDQAAIYNRKMGLDRTASRRRPTTTRASDEEIRRRQGYTYRYTAREDDEDDDEYSTQDNAVNDKRTMPNADSVIEAEPIAVDTDEMMPKSHRNAPSKPKLTWEERALAVERVPPADIPAWGPTGDLGMDARTKALSDALEDIQTAKLLVEERDRKVAQGREDIAVFRVDSELERKPLRQSRHLTSRQINEQIRLIDRKLDNMARSLRYDQLQLDTALEALAEIETRHWALLSFYDPDRAEEVVFDALRELEEKEPAVKRFKDKIKSENKAAEGNSYRDDSTK